MGLLLRNFRAKLGCLFLAVILWFVIKNELESGRPSGPAPSIPAAFDL
ncbi:hypothetical protein BH23VER1_BH23VER1_20180 [soil metagenome]